MTRMWEKILRFSYRLIKELALGKPSLAEQEQALGIHMICSDLESNIFNTMKNNRGWSVKGHAIVTQYDQLVTRPLNPWDIQVVYLRKLSKFRVYRMFALGYENEVLVI